MRLSCGLALHPSGFRDDDGCAVGRRNQACDLRGRVALVTGGRVKIGFRTVLKLLRAGARVIVTTRFPADASLRFSRERDFLSFSGRLDIYGLDLRDLAGLEHFCDFILRTYDRLDVIVNNACQTIRRPVAYYTPLLRTGW